MDINDTIKAEINVKVILGTHTLYGIVESYEFLIELNFKFLSCTRLVSCMVRVILDINVTFLCNIYYVNVTNLYVTVMNM